MSSLRSQVARRTKSSRTRNGPHRLSSEGRTPPREGKSAPEAAVSTGGTSRATVAAPRQRACAPLTPLRCAQTCLSRDRCVVLRITRVPEDQTSLRAEIEGLLAAALQSDLHHLSAMAE